MKIYSVITPVGKFQPIFTEMHPSSAPLYVNLRSYTPSASGGSWK